MAVYIPRPTPAYRTPEFWKGVVLAPLCLFAIPLFAVGFACFFIR